MSTNSRETQASKSGDPTVSVIIPTYNRAHLVGRAIRSVLNQTYQDFEIIVVDDGSTDNTEEVVKSFNDPRIRYIRHEENRGGSAARNTGIRAARGEYIAFLDDDDYWLPTKLDKQVQVAKKSSPSVGMIYTGLAFIEVKINKVVKIFRPQYRGKLTLEEMFAWTAPTPTMLVRKECLNAVGGFDEKLPRYQDPDLGVRLAQEFEFDYVEDILVFANPSNIPQPQILLMAGEHFLGKHHALIQKLPPRKCAAVFSYYKYFMPGLAYCFHGQTSIGRTYLWNAINHCPRNKRAWLIFVITLFGPEGFKLAINVWKHIRRFRGCKVTSFLEVSGGASLEWNHLEC